MGWVELEEVSELKAWVGPRTSTSLAAQVRREIKHVHRYCPGLVETPAGAMLRGPFRLALVPHADGDLVEMLKEVRLTLARSEDVCSSDALFSWLERSEPIWRSFYYYDKPGEALSSIPVLDPSLVDDFLVRSIACIGVAKRLRDVGAYRRARRAVDEAIAAAGSVPNVAFRQYLKASATLELAWLNYRMGRLDDAERELNAADASATGSALFRLRGQLLNLRSLIMRSRGRYAAALEDLGQAARLFFVEGDLFHLFAVYHNLACLIAAEAEEDADPARRSSMFRRALSYSKRNEAYCRRYGIGHNSVLHKLLQVGIHRQLGNVSLALRVAADAERAALDSQNFPDAMQAHRHRISLLLDGRLSTEAKEVHGTTLAALRDSQLKRQFAKIYDAELSRQIPSRLAASTPKAGRPGRSRRAPVA